MTQEAKPSGFKVDVLMSTDLFTLLENDSLRVLDEMMKWRNIRHIPVVDHKNRLVGLVTHRDLLKLSFSALSGVEKSEQDTINDKILVGDIMQKDVRVVTSENSLKEAAAFMYKNKFGCLPVVDPSSEILVGILTEADFVRFFVEWEICQES